MSASCWIVARRDATRASTPGVWHAAVLRAPENRDIGTSVRARGRDGVVQRPILAAAPDEREPDGDGKKKGPAPATGDRPERPSR